VLHQLRSIKCRRVGSALGRFSYFAITQVLWALVVPAAKASGRVCVKALAHTLLHKPGLLAPGLSKVVLQANSGIDLIFDVAHATPACQLPDGAADALTMGSFALGLALGNTDNQAQVEADTVLHSLDIQVGRCGSLSHAGLAGTGPGCCQSCA